LLSPITINKATDVITDLGEVTTADINGGTIDGITALTGGTGDFNWDSNTLVVDSSESRVGIGTDDPSAFMDITGTSNGGWAAKIHNASTEDNDAYGLQVKASNGTARALEILNQAGSNLFSVRGDGDVKVNSGNLVIGTAGKGITFSSTNTPAQSAGTGTSNLLDDYEEGIWTPVLSDGSNNATTGSHASTYTKIGQQVTVISYFQTSSLGSVSGPLRITGLPFTAKSSDARGVVNFGYSSSMAITAGTNLCGYVESNSTYFNIMHFDATGGVTNLQHSEWSDDGAAIFTATYFV
jgi:hypothetical protein